MSAGRHLPPSHNIPFFKRIASVISKKKTTCQSSSCYIAYEVTVFINCHLCKVSIFASIRQEKMDASAQADESFEKVVNTLLFNGRNE
jgi:Na+-translocating ferredoxin:NAD+ oxidoreductase RnfC subunit